MREKTLQELEGNDWGEPPYPSSLVIRCHALRRVPLKDFTPGDLRVMIGQQISLEYLLPLALEQLELDPYVEGDYYPGDLLESVQRVPAAFWQEHSDWKQRLDQIVEAAERTGPQED